MPIEVELPDGVIAEFPDEMSQDDIKSVLRRKFPSQPSSDLSPVLNQQPLEVPYSPGMPYGAPLPIATPEQGSMPGQFWQDINEPMWNIVKPLTEEEHRGLAREGVRPTIPTPLEIVNPVGPIKWGLKQVERGVPAAVGAAESLGNTVNFFTSPLGIATLGMGALPKAAQRAIALIFSGLMAKSGSETAGELSVEIQKPEAQRDPAKIGRLVTDFAQASGFGYLGARGTAKPTAAWLENRFTPEPIRLNDPFGLAQEMENRIRAQTAAEAGSPFVRLEPPAEVVGMGVRTQPALSMQFDPQGRLIGETFEPSGLSMAPELQPGVRGLGIPAEVQAQFQAVQPPGPPMGPGPRPATATRAIRLQGEAAQRMADWEKAMSEKVSQEQEAPLHPDKPLTENQLRIVQDSLRRAVLDNQIPGREPGLIADGPLEAWADKVFKDAKDQNLKFGGGSDKMLAAGVIKIAAMIERGVTDIARLTADIVREFGESARPFIPQMLDQAKNLRAATSKGGEKDALYQKTDGLLRDVQQPQVTQEGAGRVPVSEGKPQAPEARQVSVNDALRARGYKDLHIQKMTEAEKLAESEKPIPTQEADANRYWEIDEAIRAEKDSKKKMALIQQTFMERELIKNRNEKNVGSPPERPSTKGGVESGLQETQKEVTPTAPVTEAPTVRLYSGKGGVEGAGAGGSWFTESPERAASFGPNVTFVDVPKSVADAARQPIKTDYVLPDEWVRKAEPIKTSVAQKVYDLTEQLVNSLESLKVPETGEGRLYSLPHPDAIKAIGRSTWNSAVDVAIASIKAGKKIAEAVDEAISFLKKNVKGLDETKVRANLQFVAGQETKPAVALPGTEGESIKMRKSAERAATSPMIPEPVQERIANAPESFYQQQSMKRVEDVVGNLSDADLAGVTRDSNLYTASKLEQARRAFERGNNEAGYRVFEELEKEGTTMGQLINQFKLLKGSRPENIVRVINQTLKKAGKDVLNEKQTGEAMEIAKRSKEADAALDRATDAWTKEPTTENAAKAEQALLDANEAGLKLQRFISGFTPRSTAAIIKSVLQGNLLTPISEVANLVGNMSFLPFRALDRTVASAFDVLDNFLKGTKREITVQPVRGTAEALKGLGRGVAKMPDVFMRGTGDVIKGETRAGLHPLKAWINQFSKNPEMPTTKGKLTLQDRLNLAIEGTFGVPAEAMLRGLGAGDIPFREAAKARATATELELKGVPKDQWKFAQKFPELFLDDAALQRIQSNTLGAIFQRPSRTLNVITNWIRGRGAWFDLAVATVAPYKMTPWNIVGEILSYNPLIAAARSVNDFRTGNRLSAKLNAGKYIVGSMLTAAGWWLYKNGLLSPSLDQRDESQKARILAGEVLPPNHINLSGLKRALSGGDPTFKAGDETADVFRSGGLAGSMFYMTANIGRDFERMPEVKDREVIGAILRQSTLEQARFGMNQSFLSGVEGLLSAVREGNADNYVRQWANTVASVPLPNSLTVLSRATREYKPDFREDAFRKQVENIARNKLGFAKMDDYLPLKRGLWGEPLRETPEGRNALIYHFFDVFKNKQVTGDPVPLELFRLWRKTADTRIIPSIPAEQNRLLTIANKQYALDAAQYSRYVELVGTARRRIVDAVVVNSEFHKIPDEAKIDILEKIYNAGLQQGKAQFWNEVSGTLTEKPQRAGFAPGTPQ